MSIMKFWLPLVLTYSSTTLWEISLFIKWSTNFAVCLLLIFNCKYGTCQGFWLNSVCLSVVSYLVINNLRYQIYIYHSTNRATAYVTSLICYLSVWKNENNNLLIDTSEAIWSFSKKSKMYIYMQCMYYSYESLVIIWLRL